MTKPQFTATDDHLHTSHLDDGWWATETAWYSFHVPERNLGGWFYNMFRANIGTVAGGAWLWDDSAYLPWEVLYSANYTALELPENLDLTDCELPNGVSVRVINPCQTYALGYNDGDRFSADLVFDGVMPPEPLTSTKSTFGKASHFDQFGRVHGSITIHGEQIAVDCIGMRDRTWGRRPENRPRQAAYVTGAADADNGFLAVSAPDGDRDLIAYGFLRRDGETISLRAGERIVERDPKESWVTQIRINAVDENGRELEAIGSPVSRMIINRHTFIDINSLIHWQIDGLDGWGEDQDMWPQHRFARRQRGRRDGA